MSSHVRPFDRMIFRVLFFGVLLACLASANDGPQAADAAWDEIQRLRLLGDPVLPENYHGMSKSARQDWFEQRALLLCEKGEAFLREFPADPRRWNIAAQMIEAPPRFITHYGPGFATDPMDVTIDSARAEAWQRQLGELEAAMAVATDLPLDARAALDRRTLFKLVAAGKDANGDRDGRKAMRALLDYAAKYAESSDPVTIAPAVVRQFESARDGNAALEAWRELAASPNRALSGLAGRNAAALQLRSRPLDFSFTAVDGRRIDLRELRGKLVLVDFWATWCGPCVAEIPRLKELYAEFRDRGFEIVGICCEWAIDRGAPPGRPRRGKTESQVLEFTRREQMPWPQYYDPRAPSESFAVQHAITAYPTAFLLDREGRVVATNPSKDEIRQRLETAATLDTR